MLDTPLIKVNSITGITIIFKSLINIVPIGSAIDISFAVVSAEAFNETIIPRTAPIIKLISINISNLLLTSFSILIKNP